jgi:hypothetical protein
LASKKNRPERRAAPRRRAEVPVSFKTKESRTTGITSNLSRGGLFVRTIRPPAVGSIVQVRLRPRNRAATIVLRGKVVHTRAAPIVLAHSPPAGFAVRVLEAAEEYYEFLALLRRRSTDRVG